jgi:hypothetical protein
MLDSLDEKSLGNNALFNRVMQNTSDHCMVNFKKHISKLGRKVIVFCPIAIKTLLNSLNHIFNNLFRVTKDHHGFIHIEQNQRLREQNKRTKLHLLKEKTSNN